MTLSDRLGRMAIVITLTGGLWFVLSLILEVIKSTFNIFLWEGQFIVSGITSSALIIFGQTIRFCLSDLINLSRRTSRYTRHKADKNFFRIFRLIKIHLSIFFAMLLLFTIITLVELKYLYILIGISIILLLFLAPVHYRKFNKIICFKKRKIFRFVMQFSIWVGLSYLVFFLSFIFSTIPVFNEVGEIKFIKDDKKLKVELTLDNFAPDTSIEIVNSFNHNIHITSKEFATMYAEVVKDKEQKKTLGNSIFTESNYIINKTKFSSYKEIELNEYLQPGKNKITLKFRGSSRIFMIENVILNNGDGNFEIAKEKIEF